MSFQKSPELLQLDFNPFDIEDDQEPKKIKWSKSILDGVEITTTIPVSYFVESVEIPTFQNFFDLLLWSNSKGYFLCCQ